MWSLEYADAWSDVAVGSGMLVSLRQMIADDVGKKVGKEKNYVHKKLFVWFTFFHVKLTIFVVFHIKCLSSVTFVFLNYTPMKLAFSAIRKSRNILACSSVIPQTSISVKEACL